MMCVGAALEYEVMFRLRHGYVMAEAPAAASARREAVFRPPCQLGENTRVCSSSGST